MLKNIAEVVLKELGIENDTPFQVNEWKDKDSILWIKVKDGVSYWDAGTDKVSWYEDIVLLRQLTEGILTVAENKVKNVNVSFNFTTTSDINMIKYEIKKLVNKYCEDVEFGDFKIMHEFI